MNCPYCSQDTTFIKAGLNNSGLILFIVLIVFCIPLCWLPFVLDNCQKRVCVKCGREIQ